eukprot:11672718-Heterocapsa_arctica.AAC.1
MPPRAGSRNTLTCTGRRTTRSESRMRRCSYNEDMDARSFAHGDDFVTLDDDIAQAHLFGQLDK